MQAIWNNCIDGHINCYGTSPTESTKALGQFEQPERGL